MAASKRFVVTGRVQGVGYRYFVIQAVKDLDLRGWVRNLPDGSVEVCAEGSEEELGLIVTRLRQGPALSRVDSVREEPAAPNGEPAFRIRH